MNTFWKALIGLLAIGVVVSLVTLWGGSRPIGSENLVGLPLPDFAAPLASGTQDADSNIYTRAHAKAADSVAACDVDLPGVFNSCRDLQGDAILSFWNTTKSECVKQVETIDQFAAKRKDLSTAAVAFDESAEEVREFVGDRDWSVPVPIDRDGATAGLYAVAGCPSTFFIKDGKVTGVKLGSLTAAQLKHGLRAGEPTGSTD